MSGRGKGGVKGHSPSCPDGEVLTQEPEEVRWPVLPQAGMSPVLGRLRQGVVPHLKHTRDAAGTPLHNRWKISTPAVRCEIRVCTLCELIAPSQVSPWQGAKAIHQIQVT